MSKTADSFASAVFSKHKTSIILQYKYVALWRYLNFGVDRQQFLKIWQV